MIETIKNPSDKLFYDLVGGSENTVDLCSPFVHEDIIRNVIKTKRESSDLRLITSANLADFYSGFSHIKAIRQVISQGFKAYNYQNLHANIYLFDGCKALVTSSSLTHRGFVDNYEYGILITDETEITGRIVADLDEIMKDRRCGRFDRTGMDWIDNSIIGIDNRASVRIDKDGDNSIFLTDKAALRNQMTPWQRDVFDIINHFSHDIFNLGIMYSYETLLHDKHPNNYHITDKIRQILQQLRDMGLVRFLDRGVYKKLWK